MSSFFSSKANAPTSTTCAGHECVVGLSSRQERGIVVPECLVLEYAGRKVAVYMDAPLRNCSFEVSSTCRNVGSNPASSSLTLHTTILQFVQTTIRRDLGIPKDIRLKFYTTELAQWYGEKVEISFDAWGVIFPRISVLVVEAVAPDTGDEAPAEA
ncbi:hypothetical protein NMY22_g8971 [Coprinellus aureogranulatus]|nr:hypothetical protein NMY22_g8971 [Coprinellus aureogranulatus]